ncbi:MAG: S41 family peptidase [Alkaliphilus sp.]
MHNNKKRILITVLTLAIILFSTAFALAAQYTEADLNSIKSIIYHNNVEQISPEELDSKTLEELLERLDEHSKYYNPEEFHNLIERLTGEYSGIGAYVKEEEGRIYIVEPIKGSPSDRAGFRAGDEIFSVNWKPIRGMPLNEAVNLIRGETGTRVVLGIRRDGVERSKFFSIKREQIIIEPITYEVIEGVGYIRIHTFSELTSTSFLNASGELSTQGINSIIIDVRNNPGGSLNSVVEVSRLLVPKGPIVHIEYRDSKITHASFLRKPFFENIVVLVNERSASASEILAAAVQDTKAGTIIGTTTYGKGSVQRIYFLPSGGGFKQTEAIYLSPNKNIIDGVGITPDYIVEQEIDSEIDKQLVFAVNYLNKQEVSQGLAK